jgi:hypothetical protein
MSETQYDPYAGIESEEEQQRIYRELQAKYEKDMEDYQKDEVRYAKELAEYQERARKSCLEAWRDGRQMQIAQNAAFDKNVILLAGGSFGVSFAFIDKIVPLAQAVLTPLLITSWAAFGLCLIISLFGFLVSAIVHAIQCHDAVEDMKLADKGLSIPEKQHWYGCWLTRLCNWAALAAFTGGVGCLIGFVYLNV